MSSIHSNAVRVWGTADQLELEFYHLRDNKWSCSVPPDLVDGTYATELWAINSSGELGHWVGELYMNGGVCHFSILPEAEQ